ncbi:hypothetical protein GQ42DRAFT_159875 [Ramicandelaber brevisporus]|nr:hypothetical protein GQ42DRAFT_159875 [Ramicandelaber brevisporus]
MRLQLQQQRVTLSPQIKPGQNGHFTLPCRKIVLHYSEHGATSRDGMNEFLVKDMVKYAKRNPEIEFVVQPRPGEHPSIRAFYMNANTGYKKVQSVKQMTRHEVMKQVERLKSFTGAASSKDLGKVDVISESESVRGIWSPFHTAPHVITSKKISDIKR